MGPQKGLENTTDCAWRQTELVERERKSRLSAGTSAEAQQPSRGPGTPELGGAVSSPVLCPGGPEALSWGRERFALPWLGWA